MKKLWISVVLLSYNKPNLRLVEFQKITRFGPYRVAADMEENGEFEFWDIY